MPAFKAFLSHRYKSPQTNLYFFDVFKKIAQVQFEVDEGVFSTSVTRLEQMIRGTDAFIGIYPFPGSVDDARNPDELKKQSRYFRLEVDLALRSQKPAIIFYDQRYGSLFDIPGVQSSVAYDVNELQGRTKSPRYESHQRAFKVFVEAVLTNKAYYDNQRVIRNKIGILVPWNGVGNGGYDELCRQCIREAAQQMMLEVVEIPWPPILTPRLISILDALHMCIVDLSDTTYNTGIPAYLHGRFVPLLRLKYQSVASSSETALGSLYSGVEVGYRKDIAEWSTVKELEEQLTAKLNVIRANVRRINTQAEAEQYFRSASLKEEAVFLSYSGQDEELVNKLSTSLKNHFRKVFDYKDGSSIRPGEPWIKEIFDQLAASAIAVPVFSQSYLKSKNCLHELEQIVASKDNGKLKIFPIKLYDESLTLPSYIQNIQYIRMYQLRNVEALTQEILKLV